MAEFHREYMQAVEDVLRHWTPAMQASICRHNVGWAAEAYDFETYLRLSVKRYEVVYHELSRMTSRPDSVVDLGGFWGVLPLALTRLGFRVAMTESLQYYGEAFDRLFEFIRAAGVEIVDYDPFTDPGPPPVRADVVTAMAVVEHYPHSLRLFMDNVRHIIRPGGLLIGDAPNIAYFPRRLDLLFGRSPLVPISIIFESAVPFTGHHHELTAGEIHDLADVAGLYFVRERFLVYSSPLPLSLRHPRSALVGLASRVAFRWFPKTREVISFVMRSP